MTMDCNFRPKYALVQKIEENRCLFFLEKNKGLFSAMVWAKMVICHCDYFTNNFFKDLYLLKFKYLIKTFRVITLSGLLTILAFEISQKFNFGLKRGILKKNSQ